MEELARPQSPKHRAEDLTEYTNSAAETERVGTNAIFAALMTLAGNPLGTYVQEEPCIHCNSRLTPPPSRPFLQKVATKGAVWLKAAQAGIQRPHPNWLHVLFSKEEDQA